MRLTIGLPELPRNDYSLLETEPEQLESFRPLDRVSVPRCIQAPFPNLAPEPFNKLQYSHGTGAAMMLNSVEVRSLDVAPLDNAAMQPEE